MQIRPRILLVEDDEGWLKLLYRKLKSDEHEMDIASSVREALEKFEKEKFDIVITDLKMEVEGSKEGGFVVIKQVKELSPSTQVIVITAYGSVEYAKKSFKEGVVDFVDKSGDWIEELKRALKEAIDQKLRVSLKPNPFRPQDTDPPFLGGREKELVFFEKVLQDALRGYIRHLVVLGEWGIGKSSLLYYFKKIAQENGFLTALIPLRKYSKAETQLEGVQGIIQAMLREFPGTEISSLKNFLKKISGIAIAGCGISFENVKENQPEILLQDSLCSLWEDLKDVSKLIIVMLDDVQNYWEIPDILITLRQILGHPKVKKTGFLFILSSTLAEWVKLTSVNRYNPVRRFFEPLELKPLSREEIIMTVKISLEETGVVFTDDVLEKICLFSNGHPFEIQMLCRNLYENQIGGTVDYRNMDKAIAQTIRHLGETVFENWCREIEQDEIVVLDTLAKEEEPMSEEGIKLALLNKKCEKAIYNVNKCLANLSKKKLVIQFNELYTIQDKLFKEYIKIRGQVQ